MSFFSNTYFQMALSWLGIATLLYLFLLILFGALKIEFPQFLHVTVSALTSGYLVYRFLGPRLG